MKWKKRLFQIFHSVKTTFNKNNNVKFYYLRLNAQINCENVVIYGINMKWRKKNPISKS